MSWLDGKWVDLSHVLDSKSPRTEVEMWHSPETGWQTNAQNVRATTHSGTHIDAPRHFGFPTTIDQIPLANFVGRGVAIAVDKRGGETITASDLSNAPVEVRPGDLVFVATGWDAKLGTPDYLLHPYFSQDAADWLVDRRVRLVGFDFPSCDRPSPLLPAEPTRAGSGYDYPIHRTLLGNGVLVAENVANLSSVVGKEFVAFAFPIKIGSGDGGYARIVGLVPPG